LTIYFKLKLRKQKVELRENLVCEIKETVNPNYFKKGGGCDLLPVDQTMYVLTEPNSVNL